MKGLISKPKYFAGTFLKIKRFCRDYFSHKWVQSSSVTCANHHKSGDRDQNQNETYLQGPKTIFFLPETKTKMSHICCDQNHILAIQE